MSDGTKISWTDASWPVTAGCEHVSDGCEKCYAAKLTSGRLKHLPAYSGLAENGRFNGQIRLLPDRLDWPYHWRKPRKIFVADMSDLFYDQVPDGYIARCTPWLRTASTRSRCSRRGMPGCARGCAVPTERRPRLRQAVGMPPMPQGPRLSAPLHQRPGTPVRDMLDSMGTPPEGVLIRCTTGWRLAVLPTELFNVWLGVRWRTSTGPTSACSACCSTPRLRQCDVLCSSAKPLLGPVDAYSAMPGSLPGPATVLRVLTIRDRLLHCRDATIGLSGDRPPWISRGWSHPLCLQMQKTLERRQPSG